MQFKNFWLLLNILLILQLIYSLRHGLKQSYIIYIHKETPLLKKRKQESKPRNYTYITSDAKQMFLNLFLFQSQKIHDAANKAGIKYSSAKTILFAYRKQYKQKLIRDKMAANSINSKFCGYKLKQFGQEYPIQVITRVGM
ncbi:unnamed protein product [Paramecium pentaurelia]|uniref:Uncharacterized protein n=1 Tax=Paramecium pentaurelia TaxID=43138 RepID=A0A8S1X9T2_9CILI|nr:unnamed protein product [Paramecium pentaurelia]